MLRNSAAPLCLTVHMRCVQHHIQVATLMSALQVLCERCSSSRHSTDKCPLKQFYEQQAPPAGPPPRKLSTAEKAALYAGEDRLLQVMPVQGIEIRRQPQSSKASYMALWGSYTEAMLDLKHPATTPSQCMSSCTPSCEGVVAVACTPALSRNLCTNGQNNLVDIWGHSMLSACR